MNEAVQDHGQQLVHAAVKASPAIAPGVVTLVADWMDVINTSLSVTFFVLSIAFLLWRWRVAYLVETERTSDQ